MTAPYALTQFNSHGPFKESAKISHIVDRGTLPDSEQIWYRKEMKNPAQARNEWLAQEFLRLIISNQVETRLAIDPATNRYFILSAESQGFTPLPESKPQNFTNGTYKGLGKIVMGAYFVHETDLKNGNIGLDKDNIVVKIDGDWAFASMRDNTQFPLFSANISAYQIQNMPFPIAYRSYNWLDIVEEGVQYGNSKIIDKSISRSSQFQGEMFETMVKILLIPESFFPTFVDAFIPSGATDFINYLKERQQDLFKESLKIPEFQSYLKNNKANIPIMADNFIDNMIHFTVNGSELIDNEQLKKEIYDSAQTHKNSLLSFLNISEPSEELASTSYQGQNQDSILSSLSYFSEPYSSGMKDENHLSHEMNHGKVRTP